MATDESKEQKDVVMEDANEQPSILCEESMEGSLMDPVDDEKLSSDLSPQSVQVFWNRVWPILSQNGWNKFLTPDRNLVVAPTVSLDFKTALPGKDYYSMIAHVIDRLNRRETTTEATAADKYRRAVAKASQPFSPADYVHPPTTGRRKKSKSSSISSKQSDHYESWKEEGRRRFPKKTSAVGEQFQATDIPLAGSWMETDVPISETYAELVWDPKQAMQKGFDSDVSQKNDVISQLRNPHLREDAFVTLAKLGYDTKSLDVSKLRALDGSDWTESQRQTFGRAVFRLRRNLSAVAKEMELPVRVCHAYYLGTYKQTTPYRILKAVCIDERIHDRPDTTSDQDACAVCGDGGSLLICDTCESEVHMGCVQPPLAEVPEGNWECDACIDRKLRKARDELVRTRPGLFERVPDENADAAVPLPKEISYRPTPFALDLVESFVLGIKNALEDEEEEKTITAAEGITGEQEKNLTTPVPEKSATEEASRHTIKVDEKIAAPGECKGGEQNET